jgi:hypothetical protein
MIQSRLCFTFLSVLALALLGSCATVPSPPPPVHEARVDAEAGVARDRILHALTANRLVPSGSSGPWEVTASAASGAIDPAWVVCPRFWYKDRTTFFPRWQVARPTPLSVSVAIGLAPSGPTTTVRAEARFVGIYMDNFVNFTKPAPCSSTGVLEDRLLGAAKG